MYKEVDSVGEFYAAIIPRLTCNNAVLLENNTLATTKYSLRILHLHARTVFDLKLD